MKPQTRTPRIQRVERSIAAPRALAGNGFILGAVYCPQSRLREPLASVPAKDMVMQINHPTTLTFDDHTRLDRLMCTLTGSRSPLAAMVRRKLETAVIIHSLDPDEDLVTSGRKVRYSIDGAKEAERILSWDRPIVGDESTICIQELRGLALLGLRAGQSISMSGDGGIETIEVEKVTVVLDQRVGRVHGRSRASSRAASIASLLQHVGLCVRRHIGTAVRRIQKGRTEAALMRLGDNRLWDIGITREEIPHVASIVVGLAPGPTPSGWSKPGHYDQLMSSFSRSDSRKSRPGALPVPTPREEKDTPSSVDSKTDRPRQYA